MVSSPSFAQMRKHNIDVVLKTVRSTPGISRAEVAKEAGLSKATVSEITDALLKNLVLHETGAKASSGGRPAVGLVFNPFVGLTLGISLDETSVGISLLDLDGNICTERRSKFKSNWKAAEANTFLMDALKAMLAETHSSERGILAMGIGIPGPVDADERERSMHGKYGQAIEMLKKEIGGPFVVDSNTNMAAIAAAHELQPRESGLVLVVRLGHQVRTALLVDGKILSGSGGLAGELGHIAVPDNHAHCRCGMTGCINTLAGIGEMLERCIRAGLAADSFDDLVTLCQSGNIDAQRIVQEAGEAVGFGISSATNLVAPHVVLVSGPATAAQNFIFNPLLETMEKRCVPGNLKRCKVITEPADTRTECYGAGIVALETYVDVSALVQSAG